MHPFPDRSVSARITLERCFSDQLSVQCRRPRSQPATSNEVAFFANESVLFWCRTPWESMSEKVTWSINERPIDESDCPPHADSHCAILEFGKHLRINDLMPNDAGNIKCHTNGRSSPFLAITVTGMTSNAKKVTIFSHFVTYRSDSSKWAGHPSSMESNGGRWVKCKHRFHHQVRGCFHILERRSAPCHSNKRRKHLRKQDGWKSSRNEREQGRRRKVYGESTEQPHGPNKTSI